jgi:hypothetical protein
MLIDEAESDYIGLYEIVWDLATNAPDVPAEHRVRVAENLVRDLVGNHGGSLFVTSKWPPVEWVPVAPEEWDSILRHPQSWASPESSASAEIYWVAI